MTVYNFPGGTPSVEEVRDALRPKLTEDVMLSGSLLRPPLTDEQSKLLAIQRTTGLPLSSTKVTIKLAADRRLRRRRDVSLTVSLRGEDLVIMGDHRKLFAATCEALESFGGVADRPFPGKSTGGGAQDDLPLHRVREERQRGVRDR